MGVNAVFKKELLKKDIQYVTSKVFTNRRDIYLQIWRVNEIGRCSSKILRKRGECEDLVEKKKDINNFLTEKIGLKKSFYQNMPEATVEINLSQSEDDIFKDISATSKRYIRKYEKNKLALKGVDEEKGVSKFRELWNQMAQKKNISIWPQSQTLKLINLLHQKKQWWLFVAETPNWDIAFGAVIIFLENRIVYLYGALNPAYPWSSYRFMWHLILWSKQKGFEIFDLLGVKSIIAPETHTWSDISRFKYSLGGEHIEYIGNFDIVHNVFLYEAAKIFKNLK